MLRVTIASTWADRIRSLNVLRVPRWVKGYPSSDGLGDRRERLVENRRRPEAARDRWDDTAALASDREDGLDGAFWATSCSSG